MVCSIQQKLFKCPLKQALNWFHAHVLSGSLHHTSSHQWNFVLQIFLGIFALKCEIKLQLTKIKKELVKQSSSKAPLYSILFAKLTTWDSCCVRKMPSSLQTCCPAGGAQHGCSSRKNGHFFLGQGWRDTRPLCSCSFPFPPLLLQEYWVARLWTLALLQNFAAPTLQCTVLLWL